jgi:hypothetical protein
MNIKLLEAMYVILINYECSYPKAAIPSDMQIKEEKQTWKSFPKNLSHKELLSPYKVIKRIFKDLTPPQYREHLNEWLNEALIIKRNAEGIEAADIVMVYDNLLRLYSAAWVILQRSKPEYKNMLCRRVMLRCLVRS